MKKIAMASAIALATQVFATELPTKDGFFVGVDWSLGQGVGSAEGMSALTEDGEIDLDTEARGFFNNKTLTNSAKLLLGFQRYSARNPALGFNIKAKLGAGLALMDSMMTHFATVLGGNIPISQGAEKVTSLQIPLALGVESNFLYDFFERGAHTLGLSLGLGFEVAYSKAVQASIKKYSFSEFFKEAFERNGMSYALLSPKVGLHYYYGHHQFGMDMSFDKVLNKSLFGLQIETPIANTMLEQTLSTKLNYFFTLGFNYAYRF